MRLPLSQLDLEITRGVLKGMSKGALAGGLLAVATGAAVLALPAVPGAAVVCVATVARWAAVGSVVGGIAGGAGAWYKHRKIEREFGAVFGAPVAA
jgi:hypothetical protein